MSERLTKKYPDSARTLDGFAPVNPITQEVFDKLADYENIGTVEELAELKMKLEIFKETNQALENDRFNAEMNLSCITQELAAYQQAEEEKQESPQPLTLEQLKQMELYLLAK